MKYVNILDYVYVFSKHKRFVIRLWLGGTVIVFVILFLLMSRWYKSTTSVMPPKQKNVLGLLGSITKQTSSLRSLGLGGTSDDLAQFETILASRRVREMVVNKFGLMEVYDLDTVEKTLKELDSNVEVATGEEDVSVEIVVYDTSPQRAADMANFFVTSLNDVYLQISVSEAKENKEFLEKRYLQNQMDLRDAEEAFKEFQKKNGAYAVPEQIKVAVQAAADVQSQILMKEVQLGILSRSTSEDNPARQQLMLEISELRKSLSEMKSGKGRSDKEDELFTPFDKVPEIGMEYVRRYRDVEIQNKILEFMLPLYEQAKVEEQRNTPSLLVLDTAVPAVKASKPKRLILLLLSSTCFLVFGLFGAALKEYLATSRTTRNAEEEGKIAFIKKELHFRNILR